MILTGKYSHVNGVMDNAVKFDGAQQTFPNLLQQAGYETAIVGKWHLKTDPTGFDYWNILPGPKQLSLFADRDLPEPDTLFDDYSGRGRAAKEQDMSIEKTMNDRDVKLVAPNNLTPDQKAKWDAAYGPENKAFQEANLQGKDLVRWKYQRYIKDYLRCIASVDENVGRVLDYLDESGLADDTLVVYTSDQGFYLGDHGWFDKRFLRTCRVAPCGLCCRDARRATGGPRCTTITMSIRRSTA